MIVLDSHAWFWWLTAPSELSVAARVAIVSDERAISTLTLYELTIAAERTRIELDLPSHEWLTRAVARSGTTVLPLTTDIAIRAGLLPRDILRDPADRIIVATALHHGATLVTRDERIHQAGVVRTVW